MPDKRSLLVIISSRLKKGADGVLFLEKAIRSIFHQSIAHKLAIDVVIGVDPGSMIPSDAKFLQTVRFVQSGAASQASALNAAARELDHSYLAVLEDDDEWHPDYLMVAMDALNQVEFVSSTQIQFDVRGEVVCINDFPTPSGWVMGRKVWETIGAFNESYLLHLDSEWLGRLAESGIKRGHLVEATVPLDQHLMIMLRPWLHLVLTQGGPASSIVRHQSAFPLVRRLVHDGSGMHAIMVDPVMRERSQIEHAWLKQ
jgi:hypothetical protein